MKNWKRKFSKNNKKNVIKFSFNGKTFETRERVREKLCLHFRRYLKFAQSSSHV